MALIKVILLVDDNETSFYLAERVIKRAQVAGQVVTVHSGWEALETLKELSVNHKSYPK